MMKLFSVLMNVAEGAAENADKAMELTFEPAKFLEMLPYMGKGMLVIFVLIGAIILFTLLINKVFSKKG